MIPEGHGQITSMWSTNICLTIWRCTNETGLKQSFGRPAGFCHDGGNDDSSSRLLETVRVATETAIHRAVHHHSSLQQRQNPTSLENMMKQESWVWSRGQRQKNDDFSFNDNFRETAEPYASLTILKDNSHATDYPTLVA
jgi:hypothetical protein